MAARNAARNQVAKTYSIQAPTGGLNVKAPLADMKETESPYMENWFPTPSSVDIRNGYLATATGISGNVNSLFAYSTGTEKKLFGASGTYIYDVTLSGAVGAPVVSGLNSDRFQYITMGTPGGYFLMCVNGVDPLQYYDGTTWSIDGGTYSITGVDTSNIQHINNFKNRVWMLEKNSFRVWYLPTQQIAGTAAVLDLSGLFKLGGYIMAMGNWTIDTASGLDDFALFLTSEGEVAVYKGTDPNSSDTWNLVATIRQGAPLGRRCLIKMGSDVLVNTTDGAFQISKSLVSDRTQLNLAISDKIDNLFSNDAQSYKTNFGWQPIIYPIGNKVIINVPSIEGVTSYQYVMNTINQSWTKFTGWNAFCFENLGDNLYFGGVGGVFQCDTGQSDNGNAINSYVQQAFSYFKSPGIQKKFNMVRPVFLTNGQISPAVLVNTDFNQNKTTVGPSFTSNGGSTWNVAPWNTSAWASGNNILKQWQSAPAIGFSGGVRVVTQVQNLTCSWQSTDFIYEEGTVF